MTINKAMVILKALNSRRCELSSLRSQVATKEWYPGNQEKVVEPRYDVKKLDKKIVELENAILGIDSNIKESNAKTNIDDIDVTALLSPLE